MNEAETINTKGQRNKELVLLRKSTGLTNLQPNNQKKGDRVSELIYMPTGVKSR